MPPKRKSYSDAELAAIVSRAVADAMAARDSPRNSQSNAETPIITPVIKPCSYKDFLSCNPLYFKGTEGAIGLIRWIERMESVFNLCNCTEDNKVKFAAYTFQEGALTWWNTHANSVGIEIANRLPWTELKKKLTEKYCPEEALHRLEEEFWHLTVQGTDIESYTTKFQQFALLCPGLVDPEEKSIKRYIRGLPECIQGNVASSRPNTTESAIRLAHELMALVINRETSNNNKRKSTESHDNQNKKLNIIQAYNTNSESKRTYTGDKPYCSKCNYHHHGPCRSPCNNCRRYGHSSEDCRAPRSNNNNARGRAFVLNSGDAHQDPNVVTGMFLLNNLTTSVLCDTGTDRRFISDKFYSLLDITPISLDVKYTIELTNGKPIETNSVIHNCTFNLVNKIFSIDLMPVEI